MFQNTWYQMGRSIVDFYVRQIMRADIHHDHPLPKGAKIIVANHPCTNDPAFVTILTKEQSTILIKGTIFKIPLFGRSLRMAGHVPVMAGNGKAALEEGIRLLKAGRTVIIFPEGEISPEGGFNTPHSGAARLALATGAPVIPVGISLDQKKVHLTCSKVDGCNEVGTWYLKGPYAMSVGKPIVFRGDTDNREQVKLVTGQIMHQITALSLFSKHRLLDARRTPGLGMASPYASLQIAYKGTWKTFAQTCRVISRTPTFRAVESGLLFLLMYARHF